MDYFLLKRGSLLACAVLLGACSGTDTRRMANQDFDYLNEGLKDELVIVDGLDSPQYTDKYRIPELAGGAENYPLGNKVDVRSPVQILTLSPLARVEEGTDDVTVWFSSRSVEENTAGDAWTLIANFLASKNVAIAKLDEDKKVLETDWLINKDTFGKYGEVTDYELRQRYRFSLLKSPNKRSVGLQVALIDHEESLEGVKNDHELTPAEQHRFSVQMLNLVNIYSEIERVKEKQVVARKGAVELKIDLVEREFPLVTLNVPFDDAWEKMPDILSRLGFTVEDKDKIAASMLVSFDQQSKEYWQQNNITPLTLPEAEYRIQFGEVKGKSSISFFTDKKQPLAANVVSQLFISIQDVVKSMIAEEQKALEAAEDEAAKKTE